jgi:hypothetical protein
MNNSFHYLIPYLPDGIGKSGDVSDNWFAPLSEKEILNAEKKMGQKFPPELRRFYENIGFGMLRSPNNPSRDYQFYGNNEILPPQIAVDYMLGILEHPETDYFDNHYYMAESAYELLQPGDLPFFEIEDSSSFMIMKLNSENPNAVWFMGHEKIEDSFEKFIWNLYYDDPSYYSRDW